MSERQAEPTRGRKIANIILFILAVWFGVVFWGATTQAPFGANNQGGVLGIVEGGYKIVLHPVVGYMVLALTLLLIAKEFIWRDLSKKMAINGGFLVGALFLIWLVSHAMYVAMTQ